MTQFNHPQLGPLKGLLHPTKVRQFYNLPFAIAARFGDPILRSGKLGEDVYNANTLGFDLYSISTNYRPAVVQPPFALTGEFSIIQKELPSSPLVIAEKDGLNLAVSIPLEATTTTKLPVFVWY